MRGALGSVALAALTALACGGDTTSPDDADLSFVGTYSLHTINGSGLPYMASQQGTTIIWIRDAQLTIADIGWWSAKVEFQTDQGPQSSNSFGGDSGTWTRSGRNLNLFSTKNNKTAYTGTFSETRLDLVSGSISFAYVR